MLETPLVVGGLPGGPELLIILLLAVLLFGANKIPKLARSSGQAIGEFQKGREQVEQELEEMQDATDITDGDEESAFETESDFGGGFDSGSDGGGGGGE